MVKKYTREQFWKLYEKLPQELKTALSSDETANNVLDVCKRYNALENFDQIIEYVTQVLVGVLPPNEFQESLEGEIKIEKEFAKKIAQEINRFIFYPVKPNLEKLYEIEIAPPVKGKVTVPPFPKEELLVPPKEGAPSVPSEEGAPPVSSKEDTYREAVE